jgi:glycerol dehydrogenase-like iron-containing ADH family enzyme
VTLLGAAAAARLTPNPVTSTPTAAAADAFQAPFRSLITSPFSIASASVVLRAGT